MKSLVIRAGSVRVRIGANVTRRAGHLYQRYEVLWTDHHGNYHRKKCSLLSEAKKEAKRLAEDLARGHHHAELSLADLASFRLARQHLYGSGKSIEATCGEYAEARAVIRGAGQPMPSLSELAKVWLAHNPEQSRVALPTVAEAVETFLRNKKLAGVSARWIGTLTSQLNRFATDHQVNVADVTCPMVQDWFLKLPDLGARSKNNHLAAVQSLFNSAGLRHHPERQSIIELQPTIADTSANHIWTPGEFRRLLHTAPPYLVPVLVLGGFGKLRSSEIMRLSWSALRLKEARVVLRAGQTKTRRLRIVPLPACAVAWLRTLPEPKDAATRVWPYASQKFNADLRALAEKCDLKWRPNALRNSAVTYDQILNPDVARVAREAGNSTRVIETEYFALEGVTQETATEWFGIVPPVADGTKIVSLHERKG